MRVYESQLRLAISDAARHGDAPAPDLILKLIESFSAPTVSVMTDDAHILFDALNQEYEFINYSRITGKPVSAEDFKLLVGLIRWLKQEIERSNPTEKQWIACLVTAAYIDESRQLWRELNFRANRCQDFFNATEQFVQNCHCDLSVPNSRVPIWESEALANYKHADSQADFVGIEHHLQVFEHALVPHFLLRQSLLCLVYHAPSRLVSVSDSINNFIEAAWIAMTLPSATSFNLGLASKSPWIRFSSLYYTVKHRRNRLGFRRCAHKLLVKLLVILANDNNMWFQIMTIFNKYPVRYPALQAAMGQALALSPQLALRVYVDAIEARLSSSSDCRKEIAKCLRVFFENASQEQHTALFDSCYERWLSIMERKPGADNYCFNVSTTEYDYGIVAHIIEKSEHKNILAGIESICAKINSIDSHWYANESEYISIFNILLSQLQPYYHAEKVSKSGGDLLPNKIRIPQELINNQYLKMKFSMRTEGFV